MAEKIIQKLIALLIWVLACFGLAEAQSQDRAYSIDTFVTTGSPVVEVSTSGGSIDIIGHTDDEVVVEMFVRRSGRFLSPSDTDLDDFDITIVQDGDKIIAEARRKRSGIFSGPRNLSISFRLQVPQLAVVDGSTSGGSVSAERLFNGIKLSTSGGSVSATEIEGDIDLRTSGGSIALEKLSGTINARTSGGSISAQEIYGEADLRTSGGGIRLDHISARLSARTSGGSIRAAFDTFYDDIELSTSGGSITVNIPEAGHFNLDLRGQRVNTELRNFTGESQRNRINGRIGNGGPLLSAQTSGGSVTVRY